ncbi:MMPL family transporter [Nocardia sp. NPDC046763]|uniref:MMPL family transporter n=1 Tax=Nocardia sp. NPDC046763 TaxID=3155256 RepID=UPI0033E533D8
MGATPASPGRQHDSRRIGYRWGRLIAHHRWLVVIVWALVSIGSALLYPTLQNSLVGVDFSVPATESSRVDQLINRHFQSFGSEQLTLTFTSKTATVDSASYRATVDNVTYVVRATAGVVGVIDPYTPLMSSLLVSADKTSAMALVGISGGARERIEVSRRLHDLLQAYPRRDVSVALTGYSPMTVDLTTVESGDARLAESIGIPIALAVLIFALGGLIAGVMPLVATGIGLNAAFGLFALMSNFLSFDSLVTTVSSMIGLGLGIDYSLFVVSRFREQLAADGVKSRRERERIDHAIATAMATAGHTVAISGLVVMIALGALTIVDVPVVRNISVVVAVTVASVLLVAWTLLPATLALLGPGVNALGLPRRLRPSDSTSGSVAGWWSRWANQVIARPWRYVAVATLALVLCAIPLGWIRYGVDIGAGALAEQTSGRANAILTGKFAPGTISPITIVLTGQHDSPMTDSQLRRAAYLERQLQRDPRVAYTQAQHSDGRELLVAIASVPIDSTAATDLISQVRHSAGQLTANEGPDIAVGGTTALVVDASAEISAKVPWVVVLILGFSFIYLAVVLRSIVIPAKAVLMNLLATGAALGLTVCAFQWGWASDLLGFHSTGFVQVYLPVTVFAVVFGLSMDYEVFLIGRMREGFHRTRNNDTAIVEGIEHTARPITAAATIMIAVFASFITADVLELEQFGFALAVAVFFDAVVVRMMLVPAMMKLFGTRNWWPGIIVDKTPLRRTEALGPESKPCTQLPLN